MTKIQWVTMDDCGGSRLTDDVLINYGISNYNVEIVTSSKIEDADFYVLSNLHLLEKRVYDFLTQTQKPFVKIEHDYGYCKFYHSMCDYMQCSKCDEEKLQYWYFFNSNALVNFYMSPLQYLEHCKILKEPINNVRFVQSQVNWKLCRQLKENVIKQDFVIVPAALGFHKGFENVFKWLETNKKEKVIICGRIEDHTIEGLLNGKRNVSLLGNISYEETLKKIASAKTVLFLPQWKEPTGRVVIEGILLNTPVVTNSNLGLFSWSEKPTIQELEIQIETSKSAFWWEIINKMSERGLNV